MPKPLLSIIIPVLNEEVMLKKLLKHLEVTSERSESIEILVVDGGSVDSTISIAEECGVKIFTSKKGRAVQMNHGARNAKSETLYFLHADTFPPNNFDTYILDAIKAGYRAGCFRMQFDTKNPFLRLFAWLSRINHTLCRGGDQSLFVNREVFCENEGFNESYRRMIVEMTRIFSFMILSTGTVACLLGDYRTCTGTVSAHCRPAC